MRWHCLSWKVGRKLFEWAKAVVLLVAETDGGSLSEMDGDFLNKDMDGGSMFGRKSHLLKLLHINIQLTAQFILCLGKGRYLTGQLMRLAQFCILLFA